jgi:hypothetical protein
MWTRCRSCRQLFAAARVDERILFAAGPIDPCRHGVRWSLFPEGRLWSLALGMIAASGLGVFIVGLAPEDVTPDWNYLGATENFLFGNVGAALLGLALLCERPSRRRVGLISLLAGLAGLICLATQTDFGLGAGALEGDTAYPFPFWITGMGGWLASGGEPRARPPRTPQIGSRADDGLVSIR